MLTTPGACMPLQDPAGAAMLDSGSERPADGASGRGARQQARAGAAAAGSLGEEEEEEQDLGDLNEATKQLILDSILADLDGGCREAAVGP